MKKSNRKLLSLILVFMLVILSVPVISAGAATNTVTYEIEELSMTMDIPDSIKVVTQGVKQNDPLFTGNTFDYIETMSKIRESNAYLYGKDLNKNFEFEVLISEDQNGIQNLRKLSEKKLDRLNQSLSSEESVLSSSVYKSDSFTFIELIRNVTNDSGRYFYKDYYTVYDSMGITVRLISENDDFSDYELSVIKEIVDSIRFPSEKFFSIGGELSASLVVSFLLILSAFIVLVCVKIQNINKENNKEKRRLERKLVRSENSENEDSSGKSLSSEENGEKEKNDSEKESIEENSETEKTDSKKDSIEENESDKITDEGDIQSESESDSNSEETDENSDKPENPESEMNSDSVQSNSESEKSEDETEITEDQANAAAERSASENETEDSSLKNISPDNNIPEKDEDEKDEAISDETGYEIDLDEAIANFEVTPERRKERRERFKEKNQKRKKGFFG